MFNPFNIGQKCRNKHYTCIRVLIFLELTYGYNSYVLVSINDNIIILTQNYEVPKAFYHAPPIDIIFKGNLVFPLEKYLI